MSKIGKRLALAMMMAAMASGDLTSDFLEEPKEKELDLIVKRIPKGCREYFFNDKGEYSTTHMLKTECVFECYAINDKSAIKKYNKWSKRDEK